MCIPGSSRPSRVASVVLLAGIGILLVPGLRSARGDQLDASRWDAKVDPLAAPLRTPTTKSFSIAFPANFGTGGETTYPAVPSPFVAIGKNFFDKDMRQVWDLASKTQVGQVKGPLGWDDKTVALSGDGAYLAGKTSHRNTVEVRGTKNGRVVQSFDTDGPFTDYVRFAGSDNLIYGNLGKGRLQVSAVKSGDKVCDLRIGERPEPTGTAVSPGGAYLAVASAGDAKLELHDIKTGAVVGEAGTPRNKNFICKCVGLNFSGDGAEIAGLFESFSDYQIVVWSAATGKMLDQFDLAKTVKQPTFYKDNGLEWFPDRSAWLVLGHAVVDRQSGKKVWNLPYDDKDLKVSPRHFLDNDHAVVVSFGNGMALRTADIPRDKIQSATAIVREGGNAADAALPPLKPVDLASAPLVTWTAKPGSWAVPAPGPVAEKRLTARPINLKNKGDEARGLLFAGAGSTQVVVFGSAAKPNSNNNDTSEGLPRWLERFDLAGGRALGVVELPAASDPIALAPDAALVLLRESKAKDRLDVFTTADAKPVVGWRPYDKESGDQRAVIWADFVAPKQVATINTAGLLVVWSIPDLKPIYRIDDAFLSAPSLSPDRTRLAGFDGKALRVLDAATGALLGESRPVTGLGPKAEWKGGAFRPDGLAFAGQFGTQTLIRWDLATGKVSGDVRATSVLPADPIEWLGEHHVLLDNRTLVDFGTQRVVWEYAGAPVGGGGPDGKHWYVARSLDGKDSGRLLTLEATDPTLDKAETMLADPKTPAVLRPGARVSIQVDAAGPSNDPVGYRKALAEALATRLKANGMIVVEDGPPSGRSTSAVRVSYVKPSVGAGPDVRLVLRVNEKATGQTLQFQPFGIRRGSGVESVPLVDLICDLSLTDSSGTVGCGTAYVAPMRPFGFVLRMPAGETSAGNYLKKLQWDRIKTWTMNAVPPYFVARDGAEIVRLPGFTDLNQVR